MAATTLVRALALAAGAVKEASGVPAGEDPLRLDLPALGPASGDAPSAAMLRVFGSLYLAAELEQAGVVPIAELLADQRDGLDVRSFAAAEKLEDFANRERQWYDRGGRVQVYARLFGIGPGATNEHGTLANRDFASVLASFCHALAACASPVAGMVLQAAVQQSAQALLANLAPRALGSTLLVARRIDDQVRHAVDLLRDPAICALVGARTLQQTVVNILRDDAPDVQRLIDAGVEGQAVIVWLAGALPRVSSGPLVTPGEPVTAAAARWLGAIGLTSPQELAA